MKNNVKKTLIAAALAAVAYAPASSAQGIAPTPSLSDLTVAVELAGTMPIAAGANINSPQQMVIAGHAAAVFRISFVPT